MKKLILFLLLPLWAIAQTSTTQEQEFDYGIKNNSTQTITTPPYLTTTGTDGTQGKIPSAYIEKTDNKQNSLAIDGTGTKYPTVDAVNAALPKTYTTTVYVNTNDPNTATIFDDENPPTVNDNALKSNTDNLYIGLDASAWVYSGSTYVTKIIASSSNFYINSTSRDAGNSKDVDINRIGAISTSRYIAAGSGLVSRLGSSNIENLGSYLRLANKVGSENNQFQLNASNGVDLWNYASGVWNKRFTFSSAGDLTANSFKSATSIKVSNDSDSATVLNVGSIRYRVNGNNSYVDIVMQTGASTYEWVNIVQNNW